MSFMFTIMFNKNIPAFAHATGFFSELGLVNI